MLRNILLTVLWLPLASSAVFADPLDPNGPNPGRANPGSTTEGWGWFGGTRPLHNDNSCYLHEGWCLNVLAEATVGANGSASGDAFGAAALMTFGRLACDAGAMAAEGLWAFGSGGGEFQLQRHGNNGSVHHIELGGGFLGATLTYAMAGTLAEGTQLSRAMAWSGSESPEEICGYLTDPGDIAFCAYAQALNSPGECEIHGDVQTEACLLGDARAVASASAYSGGLAASGSLGAFLGHNEVWAANIEQYVGKISGRVGSDAKVLSESLVTLLTDAYVGFFMDAYAETCGSAPPNREVCNISEIDVNAFAHHYADRWAEARARALSRYYMDVVVSLFYSNEPGPAENDILMFGGDWNTDDALLRGGCLVTEPEPAP